MAKSDTIVALSTPLGRSGIGVIRLSGAECLTITSLLLRDNKFLPEPNRVVLRTIYDSDSNDALDRSLITYFKSPHSFTGEDVIEISCHGSPVLLVSVLDTLLQIGARAADPGEFTLRAVSNGRINLSQAEAIRDLIDAQTSAGVKQALRQLNGELSKRLRPIKEALIEIVVHLESSLEFAEDDIHPIEKSGISFKLAKVLDSLSEFTETFRSGRIMKEGLKVTFVGRPNVGKSSIFNRLLSMERAIVTNIPGTTRDSLSELLNLNGTPILLTDTAGIRFSSDLIESLGIEKTHQALVEADLVVIVIDGTEPLTAEDNEIISSVKHVAYLIVLNKCDLESFRIRNFDCLRELNCLPLSAKTGYNFETFRLALLKPFVSSASCNNELLITNSRHYDLFKRSISSLEMSEKLIKHQFSEDLILTGLYGALRSLDEITGETTSEDVLSQIFATFCIGK